jgi:hypothetical protein
MDERTPKERWQRPRFDVLVGQRYQQNEPPFDPFPTVQNIVNAAFCPVAALHDLLYGYGNATIPRGEYGVGNLFHRFIANLKNLIGSGECLPDVTEILFRFEEFAKYEDGRTKRACQIYYLEPWLEKRLGELKKIGKNANVFFEVFVANAYVPFRLGDRIISYPLRGVIDELDFDRKRIVERTIKGDKADDSPPPPKDFQVWLLWKTLTSIDNEHYPKPWRKVDFKDFELVVETPYEDFSVEKDKPEFEEKAHNAFAWISDIGKEKRATWEAWEHRACTLKNRRKECNLTWSCYGKRRTYPTSGGEFRRRVGIFFRPLFWEQMWEHHLFRYQLTMLPEDELREKLGKYVSIGKIVQERNREIVLKLEGAIAPVLERHIGGEDKCKVVFGSFNLGIEREATVKNVNPSSGKIDMEFDKRGLPLHGRVSILFPETSVLKEAPWFLRRMIQREIHKLEKWSIDDQKKAMGHSVIQMIECLFGRNVLKMEGKGEKRASR